VITTCIRSFVLVATLGGCGAVTSSAGSANDPKIISIAPDHGPAIGGITITVTGKGFSAGTPIVVVGGVEAPMAAAASDTQLTFELPPGAEGHAVDVTVSNTNGYGTASNVFTYNVRPVVLSITPAGGRAVGGTNVTLTGRGFQNLEAGIPTITIGGGVATNVQIISDQMLTATTAPSPAGTPVFTPVDIELANANGAATLKKAFSETAHGLLAVDHNQNAMVWIDTDTGNSIPLARFQRQVGACALSPTGQLFGWAVDPADGQRGLATMDPLTGAVTQLGKLADAGNVVHHASSIAFVGNTLFAVDTGRAPSLSNKLMTVNTTSGVVTVLAGGTVLPRANGILAKDANTLFFVKTANGTLDTLDTATGVLTAGPTLTGRAQKAHALAAIGATVYMADRQGTLYSVNTTNGATSVVGNIPATINGLCETPPSF
jgi:hypothetical protein